MIELKMQRISWSARRLLCASLLLFTLSPVFAYTELEDDAFRVVPGGGAAFDIPTGALLAPILIPRVPGSEGSAAVQNHFVSFFREKLPEWTIEFQNSTSKTPATGDQEIPFSNIIMRRDPPWTKRGDVGYLTLAAHYDSKIDPPGFIGAIDSAAPCAMLMQVARGLEEALVRKWADVVESGEAGLDTEHDKGVQILFLDGEEAFVEWSATDSIYGARSLAAQWENELYPESSERKSPLEAIDLFILIDLLGGPNPTVPSYFRPTHGAYRQMAKIERRMRALGLLESTPETPFLPDAGEAPEKPFMGYIADDHVPFMIRGVPILHLIPTPFPKLWHTMDDDGEHLDLATVRDWTKILTAFAAEWMGLAVQMHYGIWISSKFPEGLRLRDELFRDEL